MNDNPSFEPVLSRFGLQLSLARSWARRGYHIGGEANDLIGRRLGEARDIAGLLAAGARGPDVRT